jgi:signal transduction histidine kinase/ligand-binding sensor domain-containing protein
MTSPTRRAPLAVAVLGLTMSVWVPWVRPVPLDAEVSARPSYAITAWGAENGEPPGDVFAIAQDTRGYLWLGTPAGVVRFDGDRFRRWPIADGDDPLPDEPVYALVGATDGSLWVGLGTGVARVLDGRVTRYSPREGAPAGVSAMIEDRRGAIWAAAREGLFRFADGRWTAIGEQGAGEKRHASAQAFSLHEDAEGGIWVGSAVGVYRFADDAIALVDATALQVEALAEDDARAIWISDNDRFVRRLATGETPAPGPGVRGPAGAWRVLNDRSGQLWVATWASLMRIDDPTAEVPRIERIDYEQRMVGSPRALFEDRDRNIWVGMRGGLLRLSRASFRAVDTLEGLTNQGVRTAAADLDGSVWVATDYALNRYTGSAHTSYDVARITALHADRGGLWVSTPERFGRFVDGRLALVSVPGPFHPRRVLAMTTGDEGALWLCSALDGPMSWDGHQLHRFEAHVALFNRACNSIHADSLGRVWIGFQGGGVALFDHGTVRTFGEADGLAGGTVLAILEDARGAIWLSTPSGINRYADGTLFSLTREDAPFADIVPVLVEDGEGYLWVGVDSGAAVVRFHPRQVDDLAAGSVEYLEYAYFDETDGMQQGSQSWQAGVGGVRGADQRLWVTTGAGMAVIDPHNLPTFRRPSPPVFESVVVDGRRSDTVAGRVLPAGTSTVEVEYGTVHLSSASKLRYRYQLDGIDDDWVPAGDTRSVSYPNLPPGGYQFRVSATDTGRWTDESVLAFSIAPPFYRTSRFIVLAFMATALLVIAAWWLRLRAVQREYRLVFAERARVSREIHDTLLQSLAAIGVELETIASQMAPAQATLRGELGRLRRRVGHSLRDARDSILELRRSPMLRRPLAESLEVVLQDARARRDVPIGLDQSGRPRATPADVDAQLIRIAQEAVNNALKHGRASRIDVTLAYEPGQLVLRVADDGCGFDQEVVGVPAELGEHLGLLTMQERAARIGGRLTIDSTPGAGTTVEVVLPQSAT